MCLLLATERYGFYGRRINGVKQTSTIRGRCDARTGNKSGRRERSGPWLGEKRSGVLKANYVANWRTTVTRLCSARPASIGMTASWASCLR
jgi:hypothetical protein